MPFFFLSIFLLMIFILFVRHFSFDSNFTLHSSLEFSLDRNGRSDLRNIQFPCAQNTHENLIKHMQYYPFARWHVTAQ